MRNAPLREYNRVASLLANTDRTVVDSGKIAVWAFGGGLAVLFGVLQSRVPWWPVHPLGLMLIPRWYMQLYMLNIFLVWFGKLLILKFGGILLYRRLRPVSYGLIVGYVFAVGCSLLIDLIWFTEAGHHIHTW